jgi:hypothetical protein
MIRVHRPLEQNRKKDVENESESRLSERQETNPEKFFTICKILLAYGIVSRYYMRAA